MDICSSSVKGDVCKRHRKGLNFGKRRVNGSILLKTRGVNLSVVHDNLEVKIEEKGCS